MINFNLFLDTFSLFAPIFTAVTCILFVGFSLHDCLNWEERRLKLVLLTYLALNALVWISLFCFSFFPGVFNYLIGIFIVIHILSPIFFYRVLCSLMKMEQPHCFSPLHYLSPLLIGMVALGSTFFLSIDTQEMLKEKLTALLGGSKFISAPVSYIRTLFVVLYYSFFLRQFIQYYRWTKMGENLKRMPFLWIVYLMIMSLFPLYFSLAILLQHPNKLVFGRSGDIAAIGGIAQIIMVTFIIIRRRYLLYSRIDNGIFQEQADETFEQYKSGRRIFSGTLTRERLEEWFNTKKPYLKPNLKITDVMKEMDVNRTVVSSFINKTYGMNFNRFVNHWRIKEYERLLASCNNDKELISKLHFQAGFSELRQYNRAVEMDRKVSGKTTKGTGSKKQKKTIEK